MPEPKDPISSRVDYGGGSMAGWVGPDDRYAGMLTRRANQRWQADGYPELDAAKLAFYVDQARALFGIDTRIPESWRRVVESDPQRDGYNEAVAVVISAADERGRPVEPVMVLMVNGEGFAYANVRGDARAEAIHATLTSIDNVHLTSGHDAESRAYVAQMVRDVLPGLPAEVRRRPYSEAMLRYLGTEPLLRSISLSCGGRFHVSELQRVACNSSLFETTRVLVEQAGWLTASPLGLRGRGAEAALPGA